MQTPSVIYQYGGPHGSLCVLNALKLKATPPREFNDPFEFAPQVGHEFDLNLLSDENIARAAMLGGPPPDSIFELRSMIQNDPSVKSALQPHFANILRTKMHHFCEQVTEGYGIACFSATRENILMWSHYAEKHTGVVIGFDTAHPIFSQLAKVSYQPKRVTFNLLSPVDEKEDEAFARELMCTKHEYWSYEEEVRLLLRLSNLERSTGTGGNSVYLMPFPACSIKSISLGMRCSDETELRVREAASCIDVSIERAVPHDREFKICFQS